jgi:hypothetical protein
MAGAAKFDRPDSMQALILNPNAYGLVSFVTALVMYQMNLIGYEVPSPETLSLCWAAVLSFAASMLFWHPSFMQIGESMNQGQWLKAIVRRPVSVRTILACHALGAAGIIAYATSLASYFGSWSELGLRMLTASYEVRWAAEEVATAGTQLSYFGWLAIWCTTIRNRSFARNRALTFLSIIQFGLNLIYVARTAPLWILFGVVTIAAVTRYSRLTVSGVVRVAVISTAIGLSAFVLLGMWVGKIDLASNAWEDRPALAMALEPVYFYGTSGFAYLNRMLLDEEPEWSFARSGYPAAMLAYRMGLAEQPPAQVNEFLHVPMETNVGTFLEPLYRDGGVALVIGGLVLLPFLSGFLAIWLLRRANHFGLIGWSTICFCSFMGFFTPKFNNTPTWLFLGIGVLATVFARDRVSSRPVK